MKAGRGRWKLGELWRRTKALAVSGKGKSASAERRRLANRDVVHHGIPGSSLTIGTTHYEVQENGSFKRID